MPLGDALEGLTVLAVVVLGSLIVGNLFAACGQPRVLGPITLGIVVGTTVAALPETIRTALVSDDSVHLLQDVGTAGLLLLMFSVGTELRHVGSTDEVSTGWRLVPSVLLPIAVCAIAAWPFADHLRNPVNNSVFGWLFVGIALGVTAVPVLVLIVKDLGIGSLPVAQAALRIAVVTDGLAWISATGLVIVSTNLSDLSVPALAAGVVLLIAVSVLVPRVVERVDLFSGGGPRVVMMVVSALAGAAATQFLGFHPAIGAVVAGFFFPGALAGESSQKAFTSVIDVLLPAFFVGTAMSVPLQALRAEVSWAGLACLTTLAVAAFASKMLSGLMFGAMQRWHWRASAGLGVLLNCRGVTEIAIASVGFQANLISPFAFAVLCGLAIVTTVMTAPLYRALEPESVPDPSHPSPRTAS